MKHIVITLLLTLPSLAFSQESAIFEYLTITQREHWISLTLGTERYETFDIKKEVGKSNSDFRPIFRQVEEFEEAGWEVYSGGQVTGAYGTSSVPVMTFLMRRKK